MVDFSISKQPHQVQLELAQKVRALRKSKKWNQQELSERSGVSLGSLKRFETKGEISLASLMKLAHTLGRLNEFDQLFLPNEPKNLDSLFTE